MIKTDGTPTIAWHDRPDYEAPLPQEDNMNEHEALAIVGGWRFEVSPVSNVAKVRFVVVDEWDSMEIAMELDRDEVKQLRKLLKRAVRA